MADHPIFKGKMEHLEKKTFTDSPIEFTTSATLLSDELMKMRENGGHVLTWGEMMDNRKSVEDYLKKTIASSYSLEDPQKYNVNFLLADAKVSDITSLGGGGLVLAGSLAFPHVEGMTHPTDHHNGKYRKIFDMNRSLSFAMGEPHTFMHSLANKHPHEYPLITINSQTLPHVQYPDGEVHGASPYSVELKERPDGTLKVSPRGGIMLHGHMIDNGSVYGKEERPTVSQYLRPTPGDGIQTESHVHVPSGIYQESWFMKRPQYHTDKGPVVPLDEYVQGTYDFLDQVNSSRSTNFDHSGIWWNAQCVKDLLCVKMFLTFRVIPIVDFHEEGVETVPYSNLRRHIKNQIKEID